MQNERTTPLTNEEVITIFDSCQGAVDNIYSPKFHLLMIIADPFGNTSHVVTHYPPELMEVALQEALNFIQIKNHKPERN